MKHHGVVLDLISDGILFTGGHCQHVGAPSPRDSISRDGLVTPSRCNTGASRYGYHNDGVKGLV